jgi:hypothetical protein
MLGLSNFLVRIFTFFLEKHKGFVTPILHMDFPRIV